MRQRGAFGVVKEAACHGSQPRHGHCSLARAHLLFVFFESAVLDVMQPVFDAPMIADEFGQALRRQTPRGLGSGHEIEVDFVGSRLGLRAAGLALCVNRGDLPRLRPQRDNVGWRGGDPDRAPYDIIAPFSSLRV